MSSQHPQAAFFYQIYHHIKLSLFHSVLVDRHEQDYNDSSNISSIDKKDTTAPLTPFQKNYVSFPEFESISEQQQQAVTTTTTITAIPSFYNKPHFKPIWIR